MQNPLVSVLIPVFNAGPYIEETLSDVVAQTYTNLQIIIVNDGSTDNSIDIIRTFNDDRIILIHNQENRGQVYSLNKGLSFCTGKYIARIDADDRCSRDRIYRQVLALEMDSSAGLCASSYRILGTNRISIPPNSDEVLRVKMFFANQIGNSTVMFRRDIITENHLQYQYDIQLAEDYLLWTKILHYSKIVVLSDILAEYREHPNQTSVVKKDLLDKSTGKVQQWQLSYLNIAPTESEIYLHNKLLNFPFFTNEEIPLLLAWIDKLRQQNRVLGTFNPDIFDSLLKKRLLLAFKRLHSVDRSTAVSIYEWIRTNSDLSLKLDIKTSIKLLFGILKSKYFELKLF